MGDLAQMIYGTAQNAQAEQGKGLSESLQSGATLAMKQEELHLQTQQMQLQMAQLQQTKVQKLYDFMGAAHSYDNASDRNAYLKNVIGMRNAMGLDQSVLPDERITQLGSDANTGRLATMNAWVTSGQMNLETYFKTVNNPDEFAKIPETPLSQVSMTKNKLSDEQKDLLKRQTEITVAGMRASGFNTRQEATEYQNAINAVTDKNPTIKNLLVTQQNLQNAVSNFQKGGATPQEYFELQQAVRSNLGIKGNSTGEERAKQLASSTGIDAQIWAQYLDPRGNPQNVMQSSPALARQVLKMAELEMANKSGQAKALSDANAKQHASFLAKHPDRASDFEASRQATLQQFGPAPDANHVSIGGKLYDRAKIQAVLNDPKANVTAERRAMFKAALEGK